MASKRQRRRDNKSNVWKQDIQTEAEDDVFEAWAALLEDLPWEVGRWRPCKVAKGKVHREKDIKNKTEGDLYRCGDKLNLYFYTREGFNIDSIVDKLQGHPLVAAGTLQEEGKELRRWEQKKGILKGG